MTLSTQGLTAHPKFAHGLTGTIQAIEHLGYVQIDTLSVVERAHHHILWSRVPNYNPAHLNFLMNDKKIFEHWFHAASYLPMRDYRYVLPTMNSVRNGENKYYNNIDPHLMNEILARVEGEGSLSVRGLDKGNKGKKLSWWNYGPGKRAVERLFMQGDLMVSSRKGMEKIYDLRERCLPNDIDLSVPNLHDYAAYLFNTTMRAHGVFTWKQLLHLKTGKPLRDAMQTVLNEHIETGNVSVIKKDDAPSLYVDTHAYTTALAQTATVNNTVKVLSPFDNAIIHRERLSALFKFDYRIECYVPKAKRIFGYFCLPLLFNNKFVGRIDCKAHRVEKRFEALRLHTEDTAVDKETFLPALKQELQAFANFNSCPLLDLSKIVFSN